MAATAAALISQRTTRLTGRPERVQGTGYRLRPPRTCWPSPKSATGSLPPAPAHPLPTSSAVEKKKATSTAAFSSESEAWMALRPLDSA